MLAWLRKKGASGLASVLPADDGVAVAVVEDGKSGPLLKDCGWTPVPPGGSAQDVLPDSVKRFHLDSRECSSLMNIGDYQLLLVETPEVPAAELRAAIRWRVRELIDYHVDDASVDVFDAPASAARGMQDHLYAVVARSAEIQEQVERLQAASVNLNVIDIPELALRNIVAQLPDDANGVAMLYFGRQRGVIALVRESTLYLARPLDIGYRDLEEAGADPQRLWDMLALEIQRSLDYYDRHFQQAPISTVLVSPTPHPVPGLEEGLHNNLGLPVRMVGLDDVIDCAATDMDPERAAHCFLAVGAALRRDEKSL